MNEAKAQMAAQVAQAKAKVKALRTATQQKLEKEQAAKIEEAQQQLRLVQERLSAEQEKYDRLCTQPCRSPRKKKPK